MATGDLGASQLDDIGVGIALGVGGRLVCGKAIAIMDRRRVFDNQINKNNNKPLWICV